MRASWYQGYVGEDEYIPGYYDNLSPLFLWLCCLLEGYRAPDISRPFNYMDIAFGQGISTVVHAACYPHARFYGIDLNPAHVYRARTLARKCGVDNVTFIEGGVDRLADLDIPAQDYIVCQGTYSWLSNANRACVRAFIDRKLKPGGIFQLHYMVNPLAAVRDIYPRLLYEFARLDHASNEKRMRSAIDRLKEVLNLKMGVFSRIEDVDSQVQNYFRQKMSHLAHDMLSRDRRGTDFAEMSAHMAACGCSYVSNSLLYRLLDLPTLSAGVRQLTDVHTDKTFSECMRDFVTMDAVRRDIFQKGPLPCPPAALNRELRELRMRRMCAPDAIKPEFKSKEMQFRFNERSLKSMAKVINRGTFTAGELITALDRGAGRTQQSHTIIPDHAFNMTLLILAGYVRPLAPLALEERVRAPAGTFNRRVVERHLTDTDLMVLCAPPLAGGVVINTLERFMLREVFTHSDPAVARARILEELGTSKLTISVNKPDPDNPERQITEKVEGEKAEEHVSDFFSKRLPELQSLQVYMP